MDLSFLEDEEDEQEVDGAAGGERDSDREEDVDGAAGPSGTFVTIRPPGSLPDAKRLRTLSPPAVGWTCKPDVLMADGATAGDVAAAKVFAYQPPLLEPELDPGALQTPFELLSLSPPPRPSRAAASAWLSLAPSPPPPPSPCPLASLLGGWASAALSMGCSDGRCLSTPIKGDAAPHCLGGRGYAGCTFRRLLRGQCVLRHRAQRAGNG